ncbi:hypothetical protein BKA66DRAFT_575669 [Pyrenochaeta sp. MPI-SDFR-AT-0127]|nr:hypothetical protein BKA66DRAFT_575669 [Pyrenochaeta sp. MPI-SDFR-AT-0127]
MAITASSSIADSNAHSASRRSSWKNEQGDEASTQHATCDKGSPNDNLNGHPDHVFYVIPSQSTDSVSSNLADSKPSKTADIEAQHDLTPFKKVSWKYRIIAYIILVVVIFIWLLLIVGVLVVTDNFFPGVLRSYHMLKDMSTELSNARYEIAGLKAQVATLYQSTGRWGSIQKAIGERTV